VTTAPDPPAGEPSPGGPSAAPRAVILDCDPGIDDAFAIAFGCGHPGLALRGITTVAGNVALGLTTANALAVCEFIGCPGMPVTPGCPAPLLRPFSAAGHVHGESGLGRAVLPAPRGRPRDGHAADFLIEQTAAAPGEITLVATGPLTNIALAVRRHPSLASQAAGLVIMGGSAGRGNTTPAAEFNIACDPEAAAIVFGAGWTVTMAGLDVTLQARATGEVRERLAALGRLGNGLLLPGLAGYRGEDADPAVHDVCALALLAEPRLFTCRPARVEVETAGRWTSGMTVTDFAAPPGAHNALVALSVDVPAFWDLVIATYARLPAAAPAP
jgi:purine nucleosidase